jgi:excisionase family DNA binding protein
MDRQLLSIMDACEVVGVSRRTIYNWIAARKVEYVRTAGGSIRIFADSLWRPSTDAQGGLGTLEGRDAERAPRTLADAETSVRPHA